VNGPQRYRKRPVVIEAMQINDPLTADEAAKWIRDNLGQAAARPGGIGLRTLEGIMKASYGDWIIRGVAGEFYSCKPDIFEQTYEAADG
jgi:hypothetical protein